MRRANPSKRRLEIFSAGCPLCQRTIQQIKAAAGDDCEIVVLNMHDPEVACKAEQLGVRSVPAVLLDGRLAPWHREALSDAEVIRLM